MVISTIVHYNWHINTSTWFTRFRVKRDIKGGILLSGLCLFQVYRKQAVELGFEDYHLFLRFVQFEFASFKEDAGKPPPVFLTAVHEEDPGVDRWDIQSVVNTILELIWWIAQYLSVKYQRDALLTLLLLSVLTFLFSLYVHI